MTSTHETPEHLPPRVSVGLPVYDGDRFLEHAIDSVLGQDLEDLELIISDNGSTDRTEEICRTYQAKDSRVRYYREEANRGAAWNYNRVVELARAPYFKWMAHDDVCASSMLRRCVEVLDAGGSDVVLAYPKTTLIDDEGEVIEAYEDRLDLRQQNPVARLLHVTRHMRLVNVVHGVHRKDSLLRSRLIGAFQGSDVVLVAELAMLGQFREIPEPLFFRRRHVGSSRLANRSPVDVRRWFDPASGSPRIHYKLRMIWEHLVSIGRSPSLSFAQKLGAWPLYLATHTIRRLRVRGGRIKARLQGRKLDDGLL
jgi:glycosyltransferase involved in cell wall biosynthesis